MEIELYDTTLRDGTQREGISLSVEDKLKITRRLDDLGIHYIEGGWPGSNPKDAEYFSRVRNLTLQNAVVAAFGSTRKPHTEAASDPNLLALAEAQTRAATLVCKSSTLHVKAVLKTSLEENLRMIVDSIRFLKERGLIVIFDGEHFFDGFKLDRAYALRTLQAAEEAGADVLVLCDTNGGTLPADLGDIVTVVRENVESKIGIHTHNDSETAVAGTLVAVQRGATHVQGTINGYGERCGNANLCSIIPNLQIKMGFRCLAAEHLAKLVEVSHFVSEIANLVPDSHLPYVGVSAFAHKGGIHVDAMLKHEESYQHIDPALVGNHMRVVVSDYSGKRSVEYKAKERGLKVENGEQTKEILDTIKTLESQGFQFDGAEASFELLVRRAQKGYHAPFQLVDFMVLVEKRRRAPSYSNNGSHGPNGSHRPNGFNSANGEELLAEAMVKLRVADEVMHTAAEGNGPVNALDAAVRKGLMKFYPSLEAVRLIDYKVRVLDEKDGTEAQVRVLIESSDGEHQWSTMGCSPNIIEASWLALYDSLEYWLLKQGLNANIPAESLSSS